MVALHTHLGPEREKDTNHVLSAEDAGEGQGSPPLLILQVEY